MSRKHSAWAPGRLVQSEVVNVEIAPGGNEDCERSQESKFGVLLLTLANKKPQEEAGSLAAQNKEAKMAAPKHWSWRSCCGQSRVILSPTYIDEVLAGSKDQNTEQSQCPYLKSGGTGGCTCCRGEKNSLFQQLYKASCLHTRKLGCSPPHFPMLAVCGGVKLHGFPVLWG